MMTSNYNVLQIYKHTTRYNPGDVFVLPAHYYHSGNFRLIKFDGLIIDNVTYGFGTFLHFNFMEWANNKPPHAFNEQSILINQKLNHLF